MANDLTTASSGQISRIQSLPASVQRSVNGLKAGFITVEREGRTVRKSVPMIPQSLAPSKQDRAIIAKRVNELQSAATFRDTDQAMGAVAELLLAFNASSMNEAGARARARGYVTALEDLPFYVIAEACKRWLKGKAGEQNYNFAPSPPVLRKIAEDVMRLLQGEQMLLQRVLDATIEEPQPEFDDEYRGTMLQRLADLFRSVAQPMDPRKKTAPIKDEELRAHYATHDLAHEPKRRAEDAA